MNIALPASPDPRQNYIVAAFPGEVQKRLLPKLELVYLPLGKVLYETGDSLRYAFFPVDCIISLLYAMEDGAFAEISVVGNEGILGIDLFVGGESTPGRAIVQSAGNAFRMSRHVCKEDSVRHSEVLRLLFRYTQALITQMAQTEVCNRRHSVDQRICRWMLLSLDRLPVNNLVMTQELIANMLGVGCESVTEVAGKLQKLGVIACQRGHITVLDRHKLEEQCCECYAVVNEETARLLPQGVTGLPAAHPA